MQAPRFSGKYTTKSARIYCGVLKTVNRNKIVNLEDNLSVKWHKADKYNSHKEEITTEERIETGKHRNDSFFLHIDDLRLEDKGVYFCEINNTMGPGTELQVASKQQ